MFAGLAAVKVEERKVIRHPFFNPRIAINGRADNISPPLVCHLVKWHHLASFFLGLLRQPGLRLRFGGQEDKRREIDQPRPSLSEIAGNLRDVEMIKGKWPVDRLEEMNALGDLAAQPLQHRSRAWWRRVSRDTEPGRVMRRPENWRDHR